MTVNPRHPNYSLTKSREALSFDDDTYLNPLPRAVIRPNSAILLDGEWKFARDIENKGLSENWFVSHTYTQTADWPGSVETHISKADPLNKELWHDQIIVWYEREFPLPTAESANINGCNQIQLTFGACGYETRVWLNGIQLKTIEGELVHIGEYTSFSYELDEAILQENNRITIRIMATMDADTTRGKQESSVYKRGGIWYQTYSGGVRSIWLETVEKNRLRSRLGVVSIVEDNLVRFNITTRIHNPGLYKVKLNVYNRKQEDPTPIATDEFPLALEVGQKQQRLVLEIPDAQLWSPENPHLYRLIAQLIDENGYVSEIEAHFGLRKIESRGNGIYLNNKKIYLNGILYQPGLASYEQIKMHMHAMKKLGCNLVRIHIAGVDPRIYNLACCSGLKCLVRIAQTLQAGLIIKQNC
jgi:beta-galactosidase/beta-glucuronidase